MKADIILCKPTSVFGKIISYFTQSEFSHIALKVDDELIMESNWFGTKLNRIDEYKGKCIVLRDKSLTEEQKQLIVKFAMDKVNTPYDYKLFFGIGINIILEKLKLKKYQRNWDNPIKDICIESVMEAYKSVGRDLLPDIKDKNIYPSEILQSKILTQIIL